MTRLWRLPREVRERIVRMALECRSHAEIVEATRASAGSVVTPGDANPQVRRPGDRALAGVDGSTSWLLHFAVAAETVAAGDEPAGQLPARSC